ncbi:MAG TPA: alkaline phosphatase family protein [Verrucomicrobiae bacterium]|nr:alkaline phosphatase family protein [Verrucomicrobiae bacterium]
MRISTSPFTVNGRAYHPPARPVAVICLDGSADEYLDAAIDRGRMPNLQQMSVQGYRGLARGAMPSFTNVNNSSIVTGLPPSVHGIGGNFFYDTTTGQEVMMNSAKFLRCETIFSAASNAGRKVAVVTAKEKLRDIFAAGLVGPRPFRLQKDPATRDGSSDLAPHSAAEAAAAWKAALPGIAFSSEKANEATADTHGIDAVEKIVGRPTPPIYSADASLYVFWSGVALLKNRMADLLYLSTTDFMQHKFTPEALESLDFYAGIDEQLGKLLELGAVVGITADHGMNAKQKSDGSPNVIYLETELTKEFGRGFRVILPITDPYVVHHGALGSFAQVHLPTDHASRLTLHRVIQWLLDQPGITEVHDRATAARLMELPPDRMGDLVVISGRDVVLGRTPDYHDLKAIEDGLRSHGGRYEEMVPFILSEPLRPEYAARVKGDPRNFDIFDFTCNGTVA